MDSPVSLENGGQSLHAESRSEISPQTRNSAERRAISPLLHGKAPRLHWRLQHAAAVFESLEKLTSELHGLMPIDTGKLERQVRERAYYLWEAEGRPHGRSQMHWQMAEIATILFGYLHAMETRVPAQEHPDNSDNQADAVRRAAYFPTSLSR